MAPTKYAISSAGSVNPTLLSTEVGRAAMRCAPSGSSRAHSLTRDSLNSLSLILKWFLDWCCETKVNPKGDAALVQFVHAAARGTPATVFVLSARTQRARCAPLAKARPRCLRCRTSVPPNRQSHPVPMQCQVRCNRVPVVRGPLPGPQRRARRRPLSVLIGV